MANIRIDLDYTISNGINITFEAPCDCSGITGLAIYYPQEDKIISNVFTFKDVHGNDLSDIDELFVAGVYVKVILDTVNYVAYIQNADTNAYLEGKFKETRELMTRTARIVIGTSTNGWTKENCDYLCDGVADDVEINAAIESIKNIGGEIVILDGTYDITQTIILYSNMTLRGNGGGTILTYNPNKSNTNLIKFKNKTTSYEDVMWDDVMQRVPIIANDNNITIRNLVFDGQLISDNNTSIIECSHSNNIKILNNVFRSTDTWNVIELYHSTQVDISNNIFNNIRSTHAIELVCDDMYDIYNHYYQHIDNIIIKDNFIVGDQSTPGIAGINVRSYKYNLDNINIIGNIIRNFQNGIRLYKALRTNILNNTCKYNKYGLYMESSDYNNISGNIFMDNTTHNIYLPKNLDYAEYPYCNYNLVANNYIYGKNYSCGGGESNTFINNKYE